MVVRDIVNATKNKPGFSAGLILCILFVFVLFLHGMCKNDTLATKSLQQCV